VATHADEPRVAGAGRTLGQVSGELPVRAPQPYSHGVQAVNEQPPFDGMALYEIQGQRMVFPRSWAQLPHNFRLVGVPAVVAITVALVGATAIAEIEPPAQPAFALGLVVVALAVLFRGAASWRYRYWLDGTTRELVEQRGYASRHRESRRPFVDVGHVEVTMHSSHVEDAGEREQVYMVRLGGPRGPVIYYGRYLDRAWALAEAVGRYAGIETRDATVPAAAR
jgi:hypothetical protein